VANFVSGWWWAKGNIKFYLVMQLDPSALVAVYARYVSGAWVHLHWGPFSFHALVTLPYERKGGVFTVTDLIGQEPASVWFSRIDYLTQAARYLPPGYCQNPPPDESQHGWRVVTRHTDRAVPIGSHPRHPPDFTPEVIRERVAS
jgi:hypothetical protein